MISVAPKKPMSQASPWSPAGNSSGYLPRWIRDRAQELGDGQLSRVTERVSSAGIGANDHIEANGLAHCT